MQYDINEFISFRLYVYK